MARDRSLDEFAADDPGTSADDGENDPDADPLESTYAWSPDGGRCGECGAAVEARWRDGGDLVCTDCKEW